MCDQAPQKTFLKGYREQQQKLMQPASGARQNRKVKNNKRRSRHLVCDQVPQKTSLKGYREQQQKLMQTRSILQSVPCSSQLRWKTQDARLHLVRLVAASNFDGTLLSFWELNHRQPLIGALCLKYTNPDFRKKAGFDHPDST
jgi:hypothetical protein